MRHFPTQYNLKDDDVLYFSHIPKTAGMTFRTIVEDHFQYDEICPATLNAQVAKIPHQDLQKYRLFRGHLGFINLPDLLPEKNIVNVTVLREPVARVISHYDYILRTPGDPHHAAVKEMTLEEFSRRLTAGKVGKNIQTYHVAKAARFDLDNLSPQEILEIAKESLDRFAFVGLVERFQDSLFLLSYIFGWKPIANSRKENAAKAKKSYTDLSESTLDVIRENTQLDSELYQYAKDIFETRFAEMTQDLLERYTSGSAIASDAPEMFDLLEQHYRQRYTDLHLTPADALLYDFSQPLRGMGWQRREYPPQNAPTYRWTGPNTLSTLDLPLNAAVDTDLFVEFRIVSTLATAADIINSLTLEVNQQPVSLHVLHDDKGVKLLQGVVFKDTLNRNHPFAELTFRVNRTTSLNAVNPFDPDTRQVGVALNMVQVYPIPLEPKCSASLSLFEGEEWNAAIAFLQEHVKPDEVVIAPLAFKAKLPDQVYDYDAFGSTSSQWAVLHKGRTQQIGPMLLKLMMRGFNPVFANEVFVIFSTRKRLPQVNYTSRHVRPVYIDRVKRGVESLLKPIYKNWKHWEYRNKPKPLQGQS
jgi:hypothetical protein